MIQMKKIQLKTWFVYVVLLIANTSITADSLPAPIVLEPKDTALIQGTQLRIKWQPLESGQWCQIQVANDPAFIQLLANEDSIYGTEWTYEPLPQDGNVYYWRIRARKMEEPLLEGEGEVSTEGEGESVEGELPAEGELTNEGEPPVEGEGETPAEDEGELAEDEGEPQEGEIEEGESVEGESVEGEDEYYGCCNSSSAKALIGDWLIVGLALLVLMVSTSSTAE